jgi:hypothetical protein
MIPNHSLDCVVNTDQTGFEYRVNNLSNNITQSNENNMKLGILRLHIELLQHRVNCCVQCSCACTKQAVRRNQESCRNRHTKFLDSAVKSYVKKDKFMLSVGSWEDKLAHQFVDDSDEPTTSL